MVALLLGGASLTAIIVLLAVIWREDDTEAFWAERERQRAQWSPRPSRGAEKFPGAW